MAVGRVVVHDVGELEAFGSTLQLKRDEIEGLYGALLSECTRQETNWQDPQYTYLREEIEAYAQASWSCWTKRSIISRCWRKSCGIFSGR